MTLYFIYSILANSNENLPTNMTENKQENEVKSELESSNQSNAKESNNSSIEYTCDICLKTFADKDVFLEHRLNHKV